MITLGLDIGSTSIGWALLHEGDCRVMGVGVRVFPEGVDRDQQGGEKSKTAERRTNRGMRRQLARRARRRRQLQEILIRPGLLPDGRDELDAVLSLNPYPLRGRALDERLRPHEFGRLLIHLNQRRGFLSNRKADKARAKETKGMLTEISNLAKAIRETSCRTLGEYLARLDGHFNSRTARDQDRVRHRHTRRDMYLAEFGAVWDAQRRFLPDLLTDKLKDQIHRIIFFQRKIYWPKSVVGRCELEPKLKRCPKADRAAQRFRLLQEVNNTRITDTLARVERPLTPEERATLIAYLSDAKERTFDQIRKKLTFPEHIRFNYERAERNKLKGHETDAALASRKALGKRWFALADETKDAVVDILINEDQEDVALRRLMDESQLSQEEAERALAVNLPDGYTSYSRLAIDRLRPHLERGLLLMADDASNSALHAAGYLRPDEREVRQRNFLPPGPDLPNPLVRQAMVEVRKLVNAIIREYGRPDQIHVELAREAKKSLEERTQIRVDNARRRREREEATKEIRQMGFEPTGADKNRYRLWREQGEYCVYCAKKISQAQLFGGEADVDHILPRWRSLDNSMANKVVCHRSCNEEKGDRTPREWLEDTDPDRYQCILRLADQLPYNKRRKFIQREIVLDHFVQRQLKDTQYITRLVTQYLRCLGAPIVTLRGQMTADLRHYWGLNTILDPEARGEKNRADHRHHAIDAIVIALTDHKRLHVLANDRGKNVHLPWPSLRDDAAHAIAQINVSHRAQRRLYGALHEDTFYGPTRKPWTSQSGLDRPWAREWTEREGAYVRRKPITEIKNRKHLEKVRDATVREILRAHLRTQGIDPDQSGNYPGTAFKGDNAPRMPSGVPIKKVRMIEESETFRPVSDRRYYQYVKPGNNHHIVYRALAEGDNERWTAEVITMWEAARRARTGQPVVDRSDKNGARFVMSLAIGEAFQIEAPNGSRELCIVQKMRQDDKRLNYKRHTDARVAGEIVKENLCLSPDRLRQLTARKVVVDLLGRIRWAND
jgi:CRISPR-associated endonuclease Csn1